jgi:Flp pilus assembly secretin CpaC
MKRATGKRIGVSALAIFWTGVAATGLLAQSGTQELKMTVGKSVVIDYPSDVRQISTSNPDVMVAADHRLGDPGQRQGERPIDLVSGPSRANEAFRGHG